MVALKLTDLADESLLPVSERLQKGRSCTGVTFTVKLIMEKRIEFNNFLFQGTLLLSIITRDIIVDLRTSKRFKDSLLFSVLGV